MVFYHIQKSHDQLIIIDGNDIVQIFLDIWEDITKEPYNFDTSQVMDYLIPLETSESGIYVGPECPSVAGLAYKRELAKEFLGTDDPKELEKMLSDWDSFIEKGKED